VWGRNVGPGLAVQENKLIEQGCEKSCAARRANFAGLATDGGGG